LDELKADLLLTVGGSSEQLFDVAVLKVFSEAGGDSGRLVKGVTPWQGFLETSRLQLEIGHNRLSSSSFAWHTTQTLALLEHRAKHVTQAESRQGKLFNHPYSKISNVKCCMPFTI